MTLKVQTDRTLVREEVRSVRYVLLSFTAPEAVGAAAREPVNVSFVIDRSGSMGRSKIRLAREAILQALRLLKSTDRFSVVSYDNEIDVVVPSTLAGSEAVRQRDRPGRTDRSPRQYSPQRRLAEGLRGARAPPQERANRTVPAPDRRARQRRHHRSGATGPPRRGTPQPRNHHLHDRPRRGLRRAHARGDGPRRRRTLLLHRNRRADRRLPDRRVGRDARDRRARRRRHRANRDGNRR